MRKLAKNLAQCPACGTTYMPKAYPGPHTDVPACRLKQEVAALTAKGLVQCDNSVEAGILKDCGWAVESAPGALRDTLVDKETGRTVDVWTARRTTMVQVIEDRPYVTTLAHRAYKLTGYSRCSPMQRRDCLRALRMVPALIEALATVRSLGDTAAITKFMRACAERTRDHGV